MLALILAAAVTAGAFEVQRPLDTYQYGVILGMGRAIGQAPPEVFQRVSDHPTLAWYSIGYYPFEGIEAWNRDTIEVVRKDGRVLRAVEQFASSQEFKVVHLVGDVANSDLQRKPMRRGTAVVIFAAFGERFSLKSIAEVRLGASVRKPSAAPSVEENKP